MAVKGSFNTDKVGDFYFTVSWNRSGYSAAKNEHYIDYSVVAHNAAGKYRTVYLKKLIINQAMPLNDAGVAGSGKAYYDGDTVTSGTVTVGSSNTSGDGSLAISFEAGVGSYPGSNCSGSDSWTLDRIPRTTTLEYEEGTKGSTHFYINWSTSHTIDDLEYSLNNGSWTNASMDAHYFYVGSLSPNTAYNIKCRARRKDTQVWTTGSNIKITTYKATTPTISLSSKTSSSIKVTSGCNVTASATHYRIKKSGGSYGDWQTSATFSSLSANTAYVVQVRKKGQDSGEYGYATLNVTTYAKTTPTISLSSKTSSSVTVTSGCNVTVSSTRYRIKTSSGSYGSWQTSGTFSGLSANTAYTVQVEKTGKDSGETGTATLNVTTYAKTTPTISLSSKTSTSVTVTSGCNVTVSSTRYRIKTSSGSYGSYQNSATFSGLTPNTAYVVEVKMVGKDSGESGTKTLSVTTYQQTIPTIALKERTIKSITVTSDCNVTVSSTQYRIKKSSETTWGAWQTSATFTNLTYNTEYDVYVKKVGTESGEAGYEGLYKVKTLDIARITKYNTNWNVEESIVLTISNTGGCVVRLYLLYNNVEIIYRNNITITNGQYIFELTTEEKNQLYSLAAGETNPDFKFVVKSYYDSVLVGADSGKAVLIEFPTKAWVKINGVWKRALVWGRPTINEPWRQSLPWVDVEKNKNWKRI